MSKEKRSTLIFQSTCCGLQHIGSTQRERQNGEWYRHHIPLLYGGGLDALTSRYWPSHVSCLPLGSSVQTFLTIETTIENVLSISQLVFCKEGHFQSAVFSSFTLYALRKMQVLKSNDSENLQKTIQIPSSKYRLCEAAMSSQQSYTLHFDMITEPETANLLMTSVLHVITLPIVRLHSRKAQGGPQNVNRLYFVQIPYFV